MLPLLRSLWPPGPLRVAARLQPPMRRICLMLRCAASRLACRRQCVFAVIIWVILTSPIAVISGDVGTGQGGGHGAGAGRLSRCACLVPSRVVNVTSFTHICVSCVDSSENALGGLRLGQCSVAKTYPLASAYEYIKFCLLLFSYELHRQLHIFFDVSVMYALFSSLFFPQ